MNLDTVEEFWTESCVRMAHDSIDDSSIERFRLAFANFLGVKSSNVRTASSGKAALKEVLLASKKRRKSVLVPALNCVRVKDAIVESGCEVITYDFDEKPGVFVWDNIFRSHGDGIGVLIVTHLYGVPVDLRKAKELCEDRGIILIEDCAQTLGGMIDQKPVGTWGDAAIFSFSYDKPISLGWGGSSVVNAPEKFDWQGSIFKCITHRQWSPSEELEYFNSFVKALKARRKFIKKKPISFGYLLHRLNRKSNLSHFYVQEKEFQSLQAELGLICLERLPSVIASRNANAEILQSENRLKTWPVMSEDIEPAWLKQKVFIGDLDRITQLSRGLQAQGFRVGNFNWPNLISDCCSHPYAKQVSKYWIDVPIHQRLDKANMEYLLSVLKAKDKL